MTTPHIAAPDNARIPAAGRVRSAKSIQSVLLASRWARLLIPSLSDLFFLALLSWLFLNGGAMGLQALLADGDVGWHIRTGDYILQHHAVPHQDLFSFSKPGAPWYAWEWLADVTDSGLHSLAGLKGIVLAAAVIIALFSTSLVRRMVWHGSNVLVALGVALLGVGAASVHFLARPHVYTLLFLSISVWIIEADLRSSSESRGGTAPGAHGDRVMRGYVWWLVPLAAVWTNLHGGFLALIAILGLTAVGLGIEALLEAGANWRDLRSWNWNPALRYAALTAACAAATLVNPYGWHLHQHVFEYLRSDWIRSVVQEFQSPSFHDENMVQFEVQMLLGLMVTVALFQRRRVVEGLWIVFWAHMALGSSRHVPLFVAVAGPLIAAELSRWWRAWTAGAGKASLAGIVNQVSADFLPGFGRTSAWPFAAVALLIAVAAPSLAPPNTGQPTTSAGIPNTAGFSIRWPQDFPDAKFPTKLIHEHAALLSNSRVLTTDQWGDYLIYLNPQFKVFVDGRSDFYGPEVGNQYLGLMNGRWDWHNILEKYGFGVALVPVEYPIAQLLKTSPEWRTLVDDGKAILLVRGSTPVLGPGNFPLEPRF